MTGHLGIQVNSKCQYLDNTCQRKKLPMELSLFICLLFVGIQIGEGNGLYFIFFQINVNHILFLTKQNKVQNKAKRFKV